MRTFLNAAFLGVLLTVVLFASGISLSEFGFVSTAIRLIADAFDDPDIQCMLYLCVVIHLITLTFLNLRFKKNNIGIHQHASSPKNIKVYILLLFGISTVLYHKPINTTLIFFGALILGLWVTVLAVCAAGALRDEDRILSSECNLKFFFYVNVIFIILFTLGSLWNLDSDHVFFYNGYARFAGPWENPNYFGLLMGTGLTLALGQVVQFNRSDILDLRAEPGGCVSIVVVYTFGIACLLGICFMVHGLWHSYSRGAWCGVYCGLVWLTGNFFLEPMFGSKNKALFFLVCVYFVKRFCFATFILIIALVILCFWQLRQSDSLSIHRALSVTNPSDFSWRNRISAWRGVLEITAEYPWLGTGWNQPEPLYQNYYLSPKLTEGTAIEMNDYLILGATLGVPALVCFGMYVWLTLRKTGSGLWALGSGREEAEPQKSGVTSQRSEWAELEWQRVTCHAGAIVLLVGFWFDGGLFKLPTAATFWILLELGGVGQSEKREGGKAETGEFLTIKSTESAEMKIK